MEKGTDPTSPQVQILANRWLNLVNEFAASDHGVKQSLGQGWKEQGEILSGQVRKRADPQGVFEYMAREGDGSRKESTLNAGIFRDSASPSDNSRNLYGRRPPMRATVKKMSGRRSETWLWTGLSPSLTQVALRPAN